MRCWRCNKPLQHGELGIGRICRYRLRAGHIEKPADYAAAEEALFELVNYLYGVLRPHPAEWNIVQDVKVLRKLWRRLPDALQKCYEAIQCRDLNMAAGWLYVALCIMRECLNEHLAGTSAGSIEGLPEVLHRFARVFDALGLTGEALALRQRRKKKDPASGALDGARASGCFGGNQA